LIDDGELVVDLEVDGGVHNLRVRPVTPAD
jgi:hypothetical protein